MAAKAKKQAAPARKVASRKAPARKAKAGGGKEPDHRMYPSKLIQRPVIWELGQKFKIVTNIRQVSVTDEIGITCLEMDGERAEIRKAVKWLEKLGISVEPVEINVIDG
jgi:hypothetical protein